MRDRVHVELALLVVVEVKEMRWIQPRCCLRLTGKAKEGGSEETNVVQKDIA